jgi:glucose-6-phosphate 1-dehydrogenase
MHKIAGPSGLIMFGVTGDLSRKKLLTAIYDLANRGLLTPAFSLVGFARRDWSEEDFEQIVYEAVKAHARTTWS